MKKSVAIQKNYIAEIKQILTNARNKAYSAVNSAMVEAYWLTGKRIVEEEQKGKKRADYGEKILQVLSVELTKEFGSGFSETNIRNFRLFYLTFQEFSIQQAVPAELRIPPLSWSHYERLIRVYNKKARYWYMSEAIAQAWSYRTLDRNISTQYYERLLMSQVKTPVIKEMCFKTKEFQDDKKLEFIKNPSVLEFLGLPANTGYSESKLEKAIIDNLQQFILELGKGFAFVARQKHIKTESEDFYIDLVFYNYILKCFIIFELKTGKATHKDIGQLDMYVRMYDDLFRQKGDNSTIGILLCSETDKVIARYSVLHKNKQVFLSKYKTILPSEKELSDEIERQKAILRLQFGK